LTGGAFIKPRFENDISMLDEMRCVQRRQTHCNCTPQSLALIRCRRPWRSVPLTVEGTSDGQEARTEEDDRKSQTGGEGQREAMIDRLW
jgi:hypothetical protein